VASNIELALLTKVIDTGDFHTIERAQITEEFFSTPESKELFKYLKRSTTTLSLSVRCRAETWCGTSSRASIRSWHRTLWPSLLNNCGRRSRQKLFCSLKRLQRIAERNPFEALALLRNKSAAISLSQRLGEDMTIAGAYQMLLNQYEMVQNTGGILGIPYPVHGDR
jgi:hypothetical protein